MACETDFVAKNTIFRQLIDRTAITAMLAGDFSTSLSTASNSVSVNGLAQSINSDALLNAPLLELPEAAPLVDPTTAPKSVNDGILDAVSKLGEKIALRNVILLDGKADTTPNTIRQVIGYAHGGADAGAGRLASLVLVEAQANPANAQAITMPGFNNALTLLGRDLARQIVGFAPTSVDVAPNEMNEDVIGTALLRQPSLGGNGTVADTLNQFANEQNIEAVRVIDFIRYEAGSKKQ
jgi:translation elongation factor EF-Ts